jgi:hypothetical protein
VRENDLSGMTLEDETIMLPKAAFVAVLPFSFSRGLVSLGVPSVCISSFTLLLHLSISLKHTPIDLCF